MSARAPSDPKAVIAEWVDAVNRHDLETIVACFAADYSDVEPAHPTRQIKGGRENVRKNYGLALQGMPDLRLEILRGAKDGDTTWSEVDWSGTRRDGSREHMRGIHIFGIRERQSPGDVSISSRWKKAGSISPSVSDEWLSECCQKRRIMPDLNRQRSAAAFRARPGPRKANRYRWKLRDIMSGRGAVVEKLAAK